jgi:hypothetical protein
MSTKNQFEFHSTPHRIRPSAPAQSSPVPQSTTSNSPNLASPPQISNSKPERLDTALSSRKQTTAALSNSQLLYTFKTHFSHLVPAFMLPTPGLPHRNPKRPFPDTGIEISARAPFHYNIRSARIPGRRLVHKESGPS